MKIFYIFLLFKIDKCNFVIWHQYLLSFYLFCILLEKQKWKLSKKSACYEKYIQSILYLSLILFIFISSLEYKMRRSLLAKPKEPQIKLTNQEKVQKIVDVLEEKIMGDFDKGSLSISKKQKPYPIIIEQKNEKIDQAYKKIVQQKKKITSKLNEIQKTQKEYLLRHPVEIDKSGGLSRVKSELTKKDIEYMKKLQENHKNFERNLEQKARKYEEEIQNAKRKDKQENEKQQKLRNQRKKVEITKRLQKLEKKTKERSVRHSSEKQEIERLKMKKKLFEVLNDQWKQQTERQQQKKKEILQERAKNHHIDYGDLKQHEKKYQSAIVQHKRQLYRKRLEVSRLNNSQTLNNGEFSRFYNQILEEEQKNKGMFEQNKKLKKLYRDKIQQYSQIIKRDHQPRVIDNSNESEEKSDKSMKKIPFHSKEEIQEMGINNLQYSKSKKKKKGHRTIDLAIQIADKNGGKNSYRDYLTQTRKSKEKSHYNSQFSYQSQKNEAEKIMKSEKYTQKDKVKRMKDLAERIDYSNADVVKKVAGKIQILELIG